jgi:hypothetical protein
VIDLSGTIIAKYGSGKQWSYRKFANVNALKCDSTYFGNPCKGISGCDSLYCFYKNINPDDYYGLVPYHESKHVRYEIGETIQPRDDSIYRLYFAESRTFAYVLGFVKCESHLFYDDIYGYDKGQVVNYKSVTKSCLYYQNITLNGQFSKWSICAEEGQWCTFPNTYNIYSVLFGSGWATSWKPAGVIGHFSGDGIMCSTDTLPNVPSYENTYPSNKRFCMISIDSQFKSITGYWKKVAMCAGENCKMQFSIVQGVSSTNNEASSEMWVNKFSESMTNGFKFKFWSNSQTVSHQSAHSVTQSSSHAFTQTTSRTCSATCGDSEGAVNIWQWNIDSLENCHEGIGCPTTIYTCIYLCIPSNNEPGCLPGYCDPQDPTCSKCISEL